MELKTCINNGSLFLLTTVLLISVNTTDTDACVAWHARLVLWVHILFHEIAMVMVMKMTDDGVAMVGIN